MFRGLHHHSIDLKGRVSLPVKFREILARQSESPVDAPLIVTTAIDPCLVVYTLAEWQNFERKLALLPQFDPNVVKLKRIYVAAATECSIDKLGRLLLPAELREYAQIQKDVIFAGMIGTIEIWAKHRWHEQTVLAPGEAQHVGQALASLGL